MKWVTFFYTLKNLFRSSLFLSVLQKKGGGNLGNSRTF